MLPYIFFHVASFLGALLCLWLVFSFCDPPREPRGLFFLDLGLLSIIHGHRIFFLVPTYRGALHCPAGRSRALWCYGPESSTTALRTARGWLCCSATSRPLLGPMYNINMHSMACRLTAIPWPTIWFPLIFVKWLQLSWRADGRRWNLCVLDLQMGGSVLKSAWTLYSVRAGFDVRKHT